MAKNVEKKSKVKVDSIIVLLIAILVIAIVALGIVFVITLKTPDTIEPPKGNEVTDTSGSYSNYLQTTMADVGYKELPIASRLKSENGSSPYTTAVLGTDNIIYLVKESDNTDAVPGGTATGVKYCLENIVDIFGVETTNKYYVFALDNAGCVYQIDISSTNVTERPGSYTEQKNIIEVYANGDAIEAKLFDNSTVVLS